MLVTRYHGAWVIVPAFDEGPVIPMDRCPLADGSRDDTAARALTLGAATRVASRPECSAEF
jgi:hypothetical protein